MDRTLRTKDRTLEVTLDEFGTVGIESPLHMNIGIQIEILDPSVPPTGPEGAIKKIQVYRPNGGERQIPFEYDCAWIMPDGRIISRDDFKRRGYKA